MEVLEFFQKLFYVDDSVRGRMQKLYRLRDDEDALVKVLQTEDYFDMCMYLKQFDCIEIGIKDCKVLVYIKEGLLKLFDAIDDKELYTTISKHQKAVNTKNNNSVVAKKVKIPVDSSFYVQDNLQYEPTIDEGVLFRSKNGNLIVCIRGTKLKYINGYKQKSVKDGYWYVNIDKLTIIDSRKQIFHNLYEEAEEVHSFKNTVGLYDYLEQWGD